MSEVASEPAPSPAGERHHFQAEVSKVLDIVIDSLYSHREIFLRELVSNAADALDKLRFLSALDPTVLGEDKALEIRIEVDEKAGVVEITDTGVGMTKDELIENLGTIAHSGSRKFLETLDEAKRAGAAGPELIGQFGVGFYSAFIVADTVEVISRPASSPEAFAWRSYRRGEFEIAPAEARGRGTTIRLHLKQDAREFADRHRLESLITKYSDFVSFPIRMADDQGQMETVNKVGALWRRPRNEITDADYEDLYRHVAHDWEAPAAKTHFNIEGNLSFTGVLFVPKRRPFDLFDRDGQRGVRLYVKRVFIMEDCSAFLPEYLRFVRGVIDSEDLPLNVSRELLQTDRIARSIKKSVVGKVLSMLEKLAESGGEAYAKFWDDFGIVLKEGLHFDHENRERLAELVRYRSSRGELTSLSGYVERMANPTGSDPIYYAFGTNRAAVEGSPHIEALVSKGFEVLYMTEPIDEWAVAGLGEYKGKKLVSAMKADLALDADASDAEKKQYAEQSEEFEKLLARAKDVLESSVSAVRLSKRLTDSPSCLVVEEGAAHAHIERLLRSQGQDVPKSKRILELNANHPVVSRLNTLDQTEPGSERVREWIRVLHDQALLAEGSPLEDPQGFARRMTSIMKDALGISPRA